MPLELKYLIYVSTKSLALNQAEIDKIIKKSSLNNAKNDITGMMLYVEGRFFQVLEGEQRAIDDLYAIISQDNRHLNPIVVASGDLENRVFKDWTMRYNSITEKEFSRISGINKFQDLFGLKSKAPDNPVWMFVKKFIRKKFPSEGWWAS